jgi:AcrR family transcriptional regulator
MSTRCERLASVSEKQTRRRGAALEQAILEAAWGEVRAHGWDGFTIDGVATRAGTAKAVIYRRWDNRVKLAEEMLSRTASSTRGAFVPTDELRDDLLGFLEMMAEFLRGPFGQVIRGVVTDSDPGLLSVFGDAPLVEDIRIMVEHAYASGQLRVMPSALAMNVGHAVMMSEFLQTGTVPENAALVDLVDAVWLPALRAAEVRSSVGAT